MAKKKKKKAKRRRTISEKVIIVLGIIIALSMILGGIFGLGGRGAQSNESSSLPKEAGAPIALESEGSAHAAFMSTYDSVSSLIRT
jgi:hypothetical protein